MEEGYIKISRKILDWEWYRNINTKIVFLHLLLKANWKDGRFEGNVVPRGSLVSSLPRLAEETNLTMNELRTAIKHLRHSGEITCKAKPRYTVFTIKNYSVCQDINSQSTDKPRTDNTLLTDESHSINRRLTTIEEGKKERMKEGKNKTPLTPQAFIQEQDFSETLGGKVAEWVAYKTERKEGYKDMGLKSLCTQIKNKAAEHGEQVVCDLITECMGNGWKGIIWDKLTAKQSNPTPKPPKNKFINSTQRQFDFEKIEEMERQRRENW